MKWYIAILTSVFLLSGCAGEVDRQRSVQQEQSLAEGAAQVGSPAIVNFQEMRITKQLLELRDKEIATYAYLQAMDGSLRCLGEAVGYGVPYSAQFTNPENVTTGKPQAEPNGLFMPDSADATWIMLRDPETKKVSPVYVEPNLIVSQFKMPCKSLDQ
jgi:hypothetical protein